MVVRKSLLKKAFGKAKMTAEARFNQFKEERAIEKAAFLKEKKKQLKLRGKARARAAFSPAKQTARVIKPRKSRRSTRTSKKTNRIRKNANNDILEDYFRF